MGQNSILLPLKKKKKLKQNITNIISFCEFSYINILLSMHMYGFFFIFLFNNYDYATTCLKLLNVLFIYEISL